MKQPIKNVVLVHGAFADGSGWKRVADILKNDGYKVSVAQPPETSYADDQKYTKTAIDAVGGPVVLVGHSYGGSIITEAGNHPNVAALVYIAAFALDEGESCASIEQALPQASTAFKPDSNGNWWIEQEHFVADFAADIPRDEAEFMAIAQVPISTDAFTHKVTNPAWKHKPTFYMVASEDRSINPEQERMMAKRAKAKMVEVKSSHVAYMSHPKEAAKLIEEAASSVNVKGASKMTHEFVRYSPDVEKTEPDFQKSLETVLDQMTQHMRGSLKTEGIGLVVRDAHAKGYGLAQAEFEILSGIPAPYAQGIYTKPGRHEAMVRFSNGTNHTGSDLFQGAVVGIGLKVFDIDGPTLLEDEPDSHTFDYALINHPVFFVNTLAHYIFIQTLTANIGLAPPANLTPEQKETAIHRFLYNWVTGKGTLPPEDWAWEELGAFLQLAQHKYINLLLETYWSMGAVRHGDYVAKVRVAPVQSFADRVTRRTLDPSASAQVFRPALVAELRERPYEFDVQVQLCTDLDRMPVEKTTVVWPESLSPFVNVAKLRLPQQDIGGDDNFPRMDKTSMSAWRVTEPHRPLGNIMRSRKEVYRQSSILRHQVNHEERKEPKNLAEVFGEQMAAAH